MNVAATGAAADRLRQIERARQAVMHEGRSATDALVEGWYEQAWLERSWRRCLAGGNHVVILRMSRKKSRFFIGGTRFTGGGSSVSTANSGPPGRWFTSRSRPVW